MADRAFTRRGLGRIFGYLVLAGFVPASAGAITVTTTADENGTNLAACSLREAVTSINTATSTGGCTFVPGDSEVVLAADTYPLTSEVGEVPAVRILAPMTLRGAGQTATLLDGDAVAELPILQIETGGSVVLEDLALANLTAPDTAAPLNYIPQTAGGSLTLTDVTVRNNVGAPVGGLRIMSSVAATIIVERVTFESNRAVGISPALGGAIGCIATVAGVSVSIRDVLFRDNHANDDDGNMGGAVFSWGCDLTIENVTFDTNRIFQGGGETPSALEFGGGALSASAGTGLANQVELTNVTFFGNRSDTLPGQSAPGGALLLIDRTTGTLTASLTNVTMAGNVAAFGGDDLFTDGPVALTVTNVIFGGGGPTESCGALTGAFTATAGGGNLDTDGTCELTGPGDQTVADPGLEAALFDHGGFAPTLMLETGSPAIDGGTDIGCPATDQRGATRPQDGDGNGSAICDSGALEVVLEFADGFETGDTSAWTRVFP